MKTLLTLLFCLLASNARSVDLTVEWDDDNLTGTVTWNVYYKSAAGTYEKAVSGLLVKEFTLIEAAPGLSTFYVTAVSVDGVESDPSNVFSVMVPKAPYNGKYRRHVALQYSGDMHTWETVATYDVPDLDRAFYRIEFVQ